MVSGRGKRWGVVEGREGLESWPGPHVVLYKHWVSGLHVQRANMYKLDNAVTAYIPC